MQNADHYLPAHGTRARYVSRRDPCRCAACTHANTSYMARYRHPSNRWQTQLPV